MPYCLVVMALWAAAADPDTEPPAETGTPATYYIQAKDQEPFYGFVEEYGQQLKIVRDTPWAPSKTENLLRANVNFDEESAAHRADRLLREGDKAGFVFIDGTWISKAEQRLAARALEMARELNARQQAAARPAAREAEDAENASADSPAQASRGFGQWLPHLGLLAIALLAGGVIVKTLILAE